MSDQKRLLIAAVLMAAVLFISWQFMGKTVSENDSSTSRNTIESQSTPEPISVPEDSEVMKTTPLDTTSLKIYEDTLVDDITEKGQDEPDERTITIIIRGNGEDLVHAEITTHGGAIRSWELPQFEDMPGAGEGECINLNGYNWLDRGIAFETDSRDTLIIDEQPQTLVLFTDDEKELRYTFTPDHYGFSIESNGFDEMISIPAGVLPVSEMNVNASRYFKAQWNAEKVKDRKSGDINEVEQVGNVRWIAARSHYFAIILMPESFERAYGYIFPSGSEESPSIGIQDTRVHVFAGPLDYGRLRKLGGDTSRLVDFGWPFIREIGRLLYWFCTDVISSVSNWGMKIIVLALALKLVLLPLTGKSFKSMAKLKQVQPKMKVLQEKFKSDPKALQTAMQKLYREEGVNPLGGCLPMLMQMPVFFALYRVLANSVQLRGAPFFLWIQDLSHPEILIKLQSPILGLHGIGLLAVLMGVAMFFQQKMTMTDQKQKGMMYMMPIFMTFLFMRFPAGLTLYWFTNNILTIAQQEMIKRKLEKEQTSSVKV